MSQTRTFVFFGIAGAGKGTQIEMLKQHLSKKGNKSFVYAGTGVGFRKLTSQKSYLVDKIKETLEQGKLMPDFFATSIIASVLFEELQKDSVLVVDGYPRTTTQVEDFIDMLNFFDRSHVEIVYIELSKQESIKRNLLRGRSDDTPESLQKRYEEYVNNVLPAMEHMRKKSGFLFYLIDGDQSVEEVHQEIISKLNI